MITYSKQIIPGSSRIIADTRPGRADIYLDGEIVMNSSGQVEKTPTVIHNVTEGFHSVTFSREGYNSVTIGVNVPKASDCHAKALLNTSMFAYPMMMSNKLSNQSEICEMLSSAVDDEFNAILEYSSLLKVIDTKYYETVKDILEDETEHFNELGKIVEEIKCSEVPIATTQPSPGWPHIPVRQITYGHMVASTSPDGAEIYIDGKPVLDINGNISTTPSSIIGIITGIHTVTFKKAGCVDTSVTVDIQNGMYSDARATLQQGMT